LRECADGCALFQPRRADDLGEPQPCELGLPDTGWPASAGGADVDAARPWRGTVESIVGDWPDNALVFRYTLRDRGTCGSELPQEVHHVVRGQARAVGDAGRGDALLACLEGDPISNHPERIRSWLSEADPSMDRFACLMDAEDEAERLERASGDFVGGGSWPGGGVLVLWLRTDCRTELELLGGAAGVPLPSLPPRPEGMWPVAFATTRSGWAALVWAEPWGSDSTVWLWAPSERTPRMEQLRGELVRGHQIDLRRHPLIALDESGELWLGVRTGYPAGYELRHRTSTGWRVAKRWERETAGSCAPAELRLGTDGAMWVLEAGCDRPRIWRSKAPGRSDWASAALPGLTAEQAMPVQLMPLPSGEALVVVERPAPGEPARDSGLDGRNYKELWRASLEAPHLGDRNQEGK
jgi:hypothetical protein